MLGRKRQDPEMSFTVHEASGSFTDRRTHVRGSFLAVARQLARFTGIGFVMTLGYLGLYIALRGSLGAQGANVVAWVASAVVDTAANRRLTFGLRGRRGAARAQVEGLLVFGTGMLITSGSLLAVDALVAAPTAKLELGVLALANLVAGLLRFLLLRHWVFAPGRRAGRPL
jgi:putative flippase GtrA